MQKLHMLSTFRDSFEIIIQTCSSLNVRNLSKKSDLQHQKLCTFSQKLFVCSTSLDLLLNSLSVGIGN